MIWLVLGVTAVIVFGTLYPFGIACPAGGISVDLFAPPLPLLESRGDLVANLVLFVPFGLAVAGWLSRRPFLVRLAAAVVLGAALSFAVELAQTCVSHRTASWRDVLLNTVSAAAGAVLAATAGRAIARTLRQGKVVDVPALLLLALFAMSHLMPFVPTIDWQKWKNALKPLRRYADTPLDEIAMLTVIWLVVARLVRAVAPARPLLVLAALTVAYCAARVVVVGTTLKPSTIVGASIAFVLAALVVRPGRGRDILLAALLLGVIFWLGLAPYEFAAVPDRFLWIPFQGFLKGSFYVNVQSMAEKLFLYGGMVWLLVRAGIRPWIAGVLVAVPLAGIEAAQTLLDGRVAEITDPLLALIAAGTLALLDRRRTAAGGGPVLWPRYT